jgi:hypothetical protein
MQLAFSYGYIFAVLIFGKIFTVLRTEFRQLYLFLLIYYVFHHPLLHPVREWYNYPARLNVSCQGNYMKNEDPLTTIYVAGNQAEAQIVKGRLENEGIPVLLKYESAGIVYGITVDGLGQVKIQVPSSLAQNAKDILGEQV